MTEKKAIIMVGVPLSGKTTLRKILAMGLNNPYIYSTDDKILEMDGEYSQDFHRKCDIARKSCNQELEKALQNNQHIIWDQVNITQKKREKIFNKLSGYSIHCIAFVLQDKEADIKVLKKRLDDRKEQKVSFKVLKDMIKNYQIPSIDEEKDIDQITYYGIDGKIIK